MPKISPCLHLGLNFVLYIFKVVPEVTMSTSATWWWYSELCYPSPGSGRSPEQPCRRSYLPIWWSISPKSHGKHLHKLASRSLELCVPLSKIVRSPEQLCLSLYLTILIEFRSVTHIIAENNFVHEYMSTTRWHAIELLKVLVVLNSFANVCTFISPLNLVAYLTKVVQEVTVYASAT